MRNNREAYEWHAGVVPEDDKEAGFFKEHVPSLGNALFTLGAVCQVSVVLVQPKSYSPSIHIQASGHHHEVHVLIKLALILTGSMKTYGSDISVVLVLLEATRNRESKEHEPRDANLAEHLEVDGADAGVEGGAHEEVIDNISGHAVGGLGEDGVEIGEERNPPAEDHSDRHDGPVVVDECGKAEDVVVVEDESGDDVEVHAEIRVAVVHEGLVAQRGDGKTFLLVSGNDEGDEELEEKVATVDFPCVEVGIRILNNVSGSVT